MFAINSIFYTCYFISAVVYLISLLANMPKFSKVMGMVAFGWAMLTHGSTGAIFGFIAARETWVSSLSPFEFIFAALGSSLALLIILLVVIYRFTGRKLSPDLITSLGALVKILLIGMVILMVIGELTHLYSSAGDAVIYMLTGPYSWIFWVFLVGLGIIIPLVILFHPRTKQSIVGMIIASVLIVIGIFVKRYYLVIPGQAYPQHYYPGHIEGVWGAPGTFSFAPAEIVLSIGIAAGLGETVGALTIGLCLLVSIIYNSKSDSRSWHWGFSRPDFQAALKWTVLVTLPLVGLILFAGAVMGPRALMMLPSPAFRTWAWSSRTPPVT